jgi:hypothetical protein
MASRPGLLAAGVSGAVQALHLPALEGVLRLFALSQPWTWVLPRTVARPGIISLNPLKTGAWALP